MNDVWQIDVVATPDQLIRLQPIQRARVHCLSGTLWLTQANDPRDVILEAGERCDLARRGLVLISACSPEARLRISQRRARLTLHSCAGAWQRALTKLRTLVIGF